MLYILYIYIWIYFIDIYVYSCINGGHFNKGVYGDGLALETLQEHFHSIFIFQPLLAGTCTVNNTSRILRVLRLWKVISKIKIWVTSHPPKSHLTRLNKPDFISVDEGPHVIHSTEVEGNIPVTWTLILCNGSQMNDSEGPSHFVVIQHSRVYQ